MCLGMHPEPLQHMHAQVFRHQSPVQDRVATLEYTEMTTYALQVQHAVDFSYVTLEEDVIVDSAISVDNEIGENRTRPSRTGRRCPYTTTIVGLQLGLPVYNQRHGKFEIWMLTAASVLLTTNFLWSKFLFL